jgi:hypothetical protein
MEKLTNWSIDRKTTKAQRDNVISHMKLVYGETGAELLPPIYLADIDEMSDEDIKLLDNFNAVFFKGEVVGTRIF